jgi:NAD+ synthase (glutamine-hydrolysing)
MSTIRIALVQINSTVGDLPGNCAKIKECILKGKRLGADLIVFPELCLTGYPPEDLLLNPNFVEDNLKALQDIIPSTKGISVILGFVDRDKKGKIYNAAALLANAKFLAAYHKILLPNYGVFDEKRYFQPGEEHLIFNLADVDFGVNICEDIWEGAGSARQEACLGARVLINISASPYHKGKLALRRAMLAERARENSAFVFYCNLVGGQDELVFDGASLIINPKGKTEVQGRQFDEDLIAFDLDRRLLAKYGRKIFKSETGLDKNRFRKIDIPVLSKENKKPKFSRANIKPMPLEEELYQALVLGTHDYVLKNGFKRVAIGLSGGIDSALVAMLACDALGRDNVITVSMPSRYSSQEIMADARRLARNLGIKFITVPIDTIFQLYLDNLRSVFGGLKPDVTEENLQARIRGNILMALSNKFGWLVLTTGNKSETSVGYCTLYGDMAGGFAVVKDVPKVLVYKLAQWRNKKETRKIIPETIFTRAPTAELRLNQKDEDSLPPYRVLDPILEEYVEKDRGWKEIVKKGFQEAVVKEIIRKVDRNEYKRRQGPPGIKITPRAFGKDRRFPITNRYL